MNSPERLIFNSVERATAFTEHVEGRIQKESKPGVERAKEVVSQELAEQFEQEGHGISAYTHPWEHSEAEHVEAQQLVNIAFTSGLSSALVQAEKSPAFPRNIDLFHDVLTGKMYESMVSSRLNTYQVPRVVIAGIALFFVLLLSAILFFVYTV